MCYHLLKLVSFDFLSFYYPGLEPVTLIIKVMYVHMLWEFDKKLQKWCMCFSTPMKLMCQALWLHRRGMSLQHLHTITFILWEDRGKRHSSIRLSKEAVEIYSPLVKNGHIAGLFQNMSTVFLLLREFSLLSARLQRRSGSSSCQYSWVSSVKEQLFQNEIPTDCWKAIPSFTTWVTAQIFNFVCTF